MNDTTTQTLSAYFQKGPLRNYPRDEIIIQPEALHSTVYLLSEGFVRIFLMTRRGDKFTQAIYGPGDIFPVTGFLLDNRRHIFFQALTGCSCRVLPFSTVTADLTQDAQLGTAFLQQTIRQFRVYSDRIDNLVYKYARERLAYQLLFLAQRFGVYEDHTYTLPKEINQQVIGGSINLSRESVSRELDRLVAHGAVVYRGKALVITNVQGLVQELPDEATVDSWGLQT